MEPRSDWIFREWVHVAQRPTVLVRDSSDCRFM